MPSSRPLQTWCVVHLHTTPALHSSLPPPPPSPLTFLVTFLRLLFQSEEVNAANQAKEEALGQLRETMVKLQAAEASSSQQQSASVARMEDLQRKLDAAEQALGEAEGRATASNERTQALTAELEELQKTAASRKSALDDFAKEKQELINNHQRELAESNAQHEQAYAELKTRHDTDSAEAAATIAKLQKELGALRTMEQNHTALQAQAKSLGEAKAWLERRLQEQEVWSGGSGRGGCLTGWLAGWLTDSG